MANGGSLDNIQPGIDFFAKLKKAGNFTPARASDANITKGEVEKKNEALRTMKDKKVRRLPVVDGREVVGIITQGDVATNLPEDKVGDLVEAISAAP